MLTYITMDESIMDNPQMTEEATTLELEDIRPTMPGMGLMLIPWSLSSTYKQ